MSDECTCRDGGDGMAVYSAACPNELHAARARAQAASLTTLQLSERVAAAARAADPGGGAAAVLEALHAVDHWFCRTERGPDGELDGRDRALPVVCGCGAVLTACADCAVADWQAAHPECPACCPPVAKREEKP